MQKFIFWKIKMIIIPILLALCTWLLIIRLCNQHKKLNIFEQISFWFISALSLFVLEMFLLWVIFDKLSLIWPIVTLFVLSWVFIYKIRNNPEYWIEIVSSIKNTFKYINNQISQILNWKRYILIAILIYVLVKVIMVFQINTNMPTFDEDAVAGRDIKTKIFAENKSLVLDKNNPEYFWTDYGRYPFASLADTYFLLPYWEFVNWMSNIISPLIYLLSIILLFGIFLRKTNFFIAAISSYIFTSLPFVFIHWFGSYRNFPSWVFLFVFVFYLIDQLFNINKEVWDINTNILFPIILIWFLSSVTRNEWVMLTWISFVVIMALYNIFKKQDIKGILKQIWPITPIIFAYIINKIIFSFYPSGTVLNTWWTEINAELFNSFLVNIKEPWVLIAPFKQMFLHPDYILLFYIFMLSIILFVWKYKKMRELWIFSSVILVILAIFLFVLYSNLNLWLVTHFAFIRYPVSIILFLIFFIWYSIYKVYENKED